MTMQPDYSTISLDALRKLPTYTLPPTYQLQDGMGNGCFMDAPGFPSYFTRCIHTRHGNSPRKGPQMVLTIPGEGIRVVEHSDDWAGDWEKTQTKFQARLHRLWKPLPLEHPRVQVWIDRCKGYFKNCFFDPRQPDKTHVGDWTMYDLIELNKVMSLGFDHAVLLGIADAIMGCRGLDDEQKEVWNALAWKVYDLTDSANRNIRKFYPDYKFEPDRIGNWGGAPGDWWERLPSAPTPEECPGETYS